MTDMYFLEGKVPVLCDDTERWGRMFKDSGRQVAGEKVKDAEISTVFLGIDHRFSGTGAPLLFETMIFGGEHDQYQERCSTWEEAEAMHKRAVALVNRTKP